MKLSKHGLGLVRFEEMRLNPPRMQIHTSHAVLPLNAHTKSHYVCTKQSKMRQLVFVAPPDTSQAAAAWPVGPVHAEMRSGAWMLEDSQCLDSSNLWVVKNQRERELCPEKFNNCPKETSTSTSKPISVILHHAIPKQYAI
ncbi:hypothetical protein MCOR02_000632 [Pyricularia oryzae]|uniref:Uncharacterized protein n=1 Tax=Pyricularia oryzae TaxID=318829 RepID=A0A4P7NUB8_PYROR|nr:hypothetical protein MCOR02_000632 [Pyricularia oryzae]QBZ65992.1 hypothetical protein PoMZ_12959 [Pyricularia oryzae]